MRKAFASGVQVLLLPGVLCVWTWQNSKAMAQTPERRQWRQWSACAHPFGKSFPLTYRHFQRLKPLPQGTTFTCTCNPWLWTIRRLLNSIHENTGTITTKQQFASHKKRPPQCHPKSLQRKIITWLWIGHTNKKMGCDRHPNRKSGSCYSPRLHHQDFGLCEEQGPNLRHI